MEASILIPNFFNPEWYGESELTTEDLGWSDMIKKDAQSDYPETIFRYIVEIVGYNILFYWIKDNCWYSIETEKNPIEVRRLSPNPSWDGKYEYQKAGIEGGPHTNSKGEILATFDDPTQIWDNLFIKGTPIGEILEDSYIATLD